LLKNNVSLQVREILDTANQNNGVSIKLY